MTSLPSAYASKTCLAQLPPDPLLFSPPARHAHSRPPPRLCRRCPLRRRAPPSPAPECGARCLQPTSMSWWAHDAGCRCSSAGCARAGRALRRGARRAADPRVRRLPVVARDAGGRVGPRALRAHLPGGGPRAHRRAGDPHRRQPRHRHHRARAGARGGIRASASLPIATRACAMR